MYKPEQHVAQIWNSVRAKRAQYAISIGFVVIFIISGPSPSSAFTGPKDARAHGTLSGARTLVIAHRGGGGEEPENTISAFRHAFRSGADGIEADLRLTSDGKVVLYHDARIGRVEWGRKEAIPDLSGLIEEFGSWRDDSKNSFAQLIEKILSGIQMFEGAPNAPLVSDLTYSQLQTQRAEPDKIGSTASDSAREPVPTLTEALDAVPSGIIDLDIKPGPRLGELLTLVISTLKAYRDLDRVIIEPPDLRSAERLRAALGLRVKIQLTPGLWLAEPYQASLDRALQLKPHSISVPYALATPEVIAKAHRAGVQVWVWTVNSAETARSMEVLGVDAIKTDVPASLVTTLNQAGKYLSKAVSTH